MVQVICGPGVSLHIATGLALIGIASLRLEEALRTLALQGLPVIE